MVRGGAEECTYVCGWGAEGGGAMSGVGSGERVLVVCTHS